jgi:hypothetical protein
VQKQGTGFLFLQFYIMTGDWFMSYDEVPAERFQASGIFIYLLS